MFLKTNRYGLHLGGCFFPFQIGIAKGIYTRTCI
jgi:hypothetical protein